MLTDNAPGLVPEVEESVGGMLFSALMEEIMHQRTMWVVTPREQQQELIERMRKQVETAVHGAVRRLATAGFEYIAATIESFTSKKETKVALTVPRGIQELHTLLDRVGTDAVIVFADPKEFTDGMDRIKAMDDQAPLPLGED